MTPDSKKAAFVLIPGGFHPATIWDKVATQLRSQNFTADALDLLLLHHERQESVQPIFMTMQIMSDLLPWHSWSREKTL